MEFGILGPTHVRADGSELALGGPKIRALLAVLLLRANKVVSRDRLIDALWGECAPASASHTLDDYVSRLRKVLGSDRVETRPPGYRLRVAEGELDLDRFETRLERGRAALAADDPAAALEFFDEALALWRGSALADLLGEPVGAEAATLEERRVVAVEQRNEAALATGQTAELVPELEALVRDEPFRERLIGQLALALYLSGRQGDALATLQSARQRLAHELGLDLGPPLRELEQQILNHDPRLLPTERALDEPVSSARSSHPRRIAVVSAIAVATILSIVGAALLHGGSGDRALGSRAPQLASLDATSGKTLSDVRVQAAPTAMVSDGRTLWLADPDAGIVARVDPERGEVARIRLDGSPGELARAGNSIWVAGALSQTVSRVDLVTESVTQTIRVSDASITALAAGAGSVWAADGSSDRLLAIDPRSGNIRRAIDVGLHPTALAVGAGAIWIADYAAHSVAELDPGSGQTLATVAVGNGPTSIAVGDDGVWTANALDSTVSRIDPASDAVVATIPVDSTPVALQPVAGGIWVASEYKATLSEIDPSTNRVVRRRALAGRPYVFAADGSRLWLDVRPPPAPRGGRLVLLQRPAISIDPGRAALWSPFQSTGLVHDGLVTFNHAGGPAGLQLVPDLAVALPTPTDAGKTYTFRLRPGIPYSDGRPVRAADFRRGVERSFTMRSLDRDLFDGIVGARACLVRRSTPCDLHRGVVTDERARTVTFHLTHPDAQFLSKLTNGGFAMPVPAGTPMHPTGNTPIPGTGPYEVESADRHHIRYVRNPHFREWSHAAQPAAQADEIVWRFGLSPQAEAREVARGRADWVADPIPARLHPLLRIRYAARLHSYPSPDTEFLQFNMRRAPFDDVRARRAVNLALDRRLIAQIVGGRDIAQPACQLLPPGLRGYTRYCPYRHSLAAARRLVAASGTRGMRVTVWGSRDDPYAPRALTRDVASALRRIGYRTRINEVTQAYLAQAPARVFAHMQIGPPTGWSDFTAYNFFEPWMSCNGAFNHRWHCDPRLDGAIERARSLEAREPRAAAALAARIDRKLVDEAVVAPYVNLQQTDFVSSRVTDLQHHAYLGLLVSQVRVR